jgi:integrase
MKERDPWEKVPGTHGVYRSGRQHHINFRDRYDSVHSRSAGPSLDYAIKARQEIHRLKRAGRGLPPRSETLNELTQAWIKQLQQRVKEKKISKRTLDRSVEIVDNQIRPYFDINARREFGVAQVWSIDRFVVDAFAHHLANRLAVSTQQLALKTLGQLMEFAVERDVHGYNPVTEYKLHATTATRRPRRTPAPPPRTLSEQELTALLYSAPEQWGLVFRCMARTGLLVSEVLALQWRDVVERDLLVRRLLHPGGTFTPLPTTDSRRRRLPLPDDLRRAFAHARGSVAVRRDHGLVFANPKGQPRSIRSLHLAFQNTCRRAGLEETLKPITLRHTHAAQLITADLDCTQIAARLGHKHFASTYRTYAGLFAKADRLHEAQAHR